MKLNKMTKEDLELYSYTDLSKMILEENKKPLNTQAIFKEICKLLELTEEQYIEKIGDYYTSLTTDKDFVLLSDGNWDLRDHHPVATILNESDEVYEEEELEEIEEIEQIEEEIIDDPDDIEDVELDDLEEDEGLTIIDEEELEE